MADRGPPPQPSTPEAADCADVQHRGGAPSSWGIARGCRGHVVAVAGGYGSRRRQEVQWQRGGMVVGGEVAARIQCWASTAAANTGSAWERSDLEAACDILGCSSEMEVPVSTFKAKYYT